jgi:hypothetical protein
MLLAEDLLILTIDPAGGLVGDGDHASSRDAFARALLIELAVFGAIGLDQGRIRVIETPPKLHRLLAMAMQALGNTSFTPAAAISRMRRRMWSVRSDLMDGFERLGIIHRLHTGIFGRFGRARFALQSTQTRAERVAKLKRGCETPSLGDLSAVALALLAESLGLAEHFLTSEPRLRLRGWASIMRSDRPELANTDMEARRRLIVVLAIIQAE